MPSGGGLSLSSGAWVTTQSIVPPEDKVGGAVAQTPSIRTATCASGKQPGES